MFLVQNSPSVVGHCFAALSFLQNSTGFYDPEMLQEREEATASVMSKVVPPGSISVALLLGLVWNKKQWVGRRFLNKLK